MSNSTATSSTGRAQWIALAVLALPCMLVTMDLTVLFLAVPKLTASLQPSATELLWITDVYGFVIAGALVVMGSLGDRVGRRRILLTGAAAFAAASLLAAASTSPAMLIAARYLQLTLGLSALEAGLWSLPPIAGLMISASAVAKLAARYESRWRHECGAAAGH